MPVYHLLIIFHRLYLPNSAIFTNRGEMRCSMAIVGLGVDLRNLQNCHLQTELARIESLLILVSLCQTAVGLGNAGM